MGKILDNPDKFFEYLTEEELEEMLNDMKINYNKKNDNEEYGNTCNNFKFELIDDVWVAKDCHECCSDCNSYRNNNCISDCPLDIEGSCERCKFNLEEIRTLGLI